VHPAAVELFHAAKFYIRFSERFKRARKRNIYINYSGR